jgi:glycosyltransferase involved in cell wall biosynthesis
MRIGIDAHAAEREGSGNCTYIRGLLTGLAEIDDKNDYILYVTNIHHPFYNDFRHIKNFSLKLLKPKHPIIRIPFSLARKTLIDNLDILHVQYIGPPFIKGKLIVTIHDLAFIRLPNYFSNIERMRSRILIPKNAKRATKIITGSHFSRKDIIQLCKVEAGKIEVIPYGSPDLDHSLQNQQLKEKVLNTYGIKKKFIFSLSRLNFRKNLESLIDAYTTLRKNEEMDLALVIGGKKDYFADNILKKIKNSGYEKDIILTGFIPDDQLPIFYSSAEIFVYPSLFEGFGFPPLEAMRYGCPAITSDVSSLPEVVGEAAILINPLDVVDISDAMGRVISDERLKKRMTTKGLERARLFNWKKTAKKTLETYEEAYRQ